MSFWDQLRFSKDVRSLCPKIFKSVSRNVMLRKIRRLKRVSKVSSKIKDQQLPQESLDRRRFRGNFLCPDIDSRVAISVGFYIFVLGITGYTVQDVWRFNDLVADPKLLKQVVDAAFKGGESFDKDWRIIVHLDKVRDYADIVPLEDMFPDFLHWNSPKYRSWNGSQTLWKEKFTQTVRSVLKEEKGKKSNSYPGMSIEQWVINRLNWAKTGSATTKYKYEPTVNYKDVTYKMEKSKWALAWSINDTELLSMVNNTTPAYSKVFQKRETGKTRLVIAGNIELYLKMHYLSEKYIDKFFSNSSTSTLWMNEDQKIDFWLNSAIFKDYCMPLDQQNFDHNQLKFQVIETVVALKEFFSEFCEPHDIIVFDMIIEEMENGVIDFNGQIFRWLNGLLSGQKWTALIGTLINKTLIRMAQLYIEDKGIKSDITQLVCQGDDDLIRSKSLKTLVAIYSALIDFGLEINEKKFFISMKRDEFLRKVILPGIVTGYPARAITSLIWANPVKNEVKALNGITLLDQWKLLADRLNVNLSKLPYQLDLRNALNWSDSDIAKYIQIPSSLSGPGLVLPQHTTYAFENILTPLPQFNYDGAGVRSIARQFGHADQWLKYVSSTVNIYGNGTPDKSYGPDVPKKYITDKSRAKIFTGKENRSYAKQKGRLWFKDWHEVRNNFQLTRSDIKNKNKKFNSTIYSWKTVKLRKSRIKIPKVEAILPATTQVISVLRDKSPDLIKNYSSIIDFYKRLNCSTFITQLFMYEKPSISFPRINGVGVLFSSYLANKFKHYAEATLFSVKRPNLNLWKDINLTIESYVRVYLNQYQGVMLRE